MPKSYDVIVIGTGSAGFSAAEAARQNGASVCVVEKEKLGGECPNWACVPSKALLRSAKAYNEVLHSETFGVSKSSPKANFGKMMDYRKKVVENTTGGGVYGNRYQDLLKKLKIDLIQGEASFIDDKTISVGKKKLKGKTFVIATGSVDFIPPIEGIEKVPYMTFKQAVTLTKQPASMIVIGGGPVGSELSTFYNAIGTQVTLLQGAPTILNREDEEVARLAHEYMVNSGINAIGSAKVLRVSKQSSGIKVKAEVKGKITEFKAQKLLIATGKRAAVKSLNLEGVGVALDERGYIKTNLSQQTNLKNVFAAGDCDGGYQFTHTAHYEGAIAGYNAQLAAKRKKGSMRRGEQKVVPRATFVHPEVASVGMTQQEAKEKFKKVLVGRFPTAALGRSNTDSAGRGLIKIIAHPKTRKVIGGHMICERAGEVIHEVALAMFLGAKVDKLASMIHAFPTYSEAVTAAASNLKEE